VMLVLAAATDENESRYCDDQKTFHGHSLSCKTASEENVYMIQ
jgi:hypothetical protein